MRRLDSKDLSQSVDCVLHVCRAGSRITVTNSSDPDWWKVRSLVLLSANRLRTFMQNTEDANIYTRARTHTH